MVVGNSIYSGALAGCASSLLLQPLDVIKTRLQERSKIPKGGFAQGGLRELSKVLVRTVKNDGIGGFWKGSTPTLLRNVPGVAIYFTSVQQLRYLVRVGHEREAPFISALYGSQEGLNGKGKMLVGASARTMTGMLLMPVTVLKVRFESSQYAYKSIFDGVRRIVASDGIKGFWRGFGATAMRDAPHAGLYLWFYGNMKKVFDADQGVANRLVAGSSSGFMATTITQPFDLIKTRIQLNPEKYPRFVATVRTVFREEGLSGFFKGMAPRLLRKSLSAAVTWTVYEELIGRINTSNSGASKY